MSAKKTSNASGVAAGDIAAGIPMDPIDVVIEKLLR